MSDVEAIRNLLAAYCHAADDGRMDDYVALFTPDGVLVEEGRDIPIARVHSLAAHFKAARGDQPALKGIKHLTMNHWVSVEGDTARAVCDLMTVEMKSGNDWLISGNGRYTDELVRIQGQWRISRRVVTWYRNLPRRVGDPETGKLLGEVIDAALASEAST